MPNQKNNSGAFQKKELRKHSGGQAPQKEKGAEKTAAKKLIKLILPSAALCAGESDGRPYPNGCKAY